MNGDTKFSIESSDFSLLLWYFHMWFFEDLDGTHLRVEMKNGELQVQHP